ncbi:helix-turn-helix domain-containing protein [Herbiconiux moechotypicola]|uniref:IclR family transcriptional regulator n=1 Tax=Herbiconiux moechotypicola TaxID=637393 RepID=A0ABP5QF48_9MICO|nr:helix-turn-helix domain-containing protein [Herbiconiux moechotypicola]MCS5729951.1 helix-turn-helix domain-containing protein [Herbiconiux moechotypicola]
MTGEAQPLSTPPSAPADLRARQPKAVHSALAVLEEVARCGAGVTAQQVSENLGMPRATTYRLINLLVQDEYLVRMPDLRGFTLGRKVVELAHLVAPVAPPQAAVAVVDELRAGIRGGVHLVRYEGDRMRVVDVDPDFPLSDSRRLTAELDTSAMGRLLVAELLEQGAPLPPEVRPIVRQSPERLESIRRGVALEGRAWQVDAFTPGFGCLALPIRGPRGELVASLTLSAPRIRIEQPGPVLDQLLDGTRRLAPPPPLTAPRIPLLPRIE